MYLDSGEGFPFSRAIVVLTLFLLSYLFLVYHPLEVVSRYRDPQLQVGENCTYLFNLRPNICTF